MKKSLFLLLSILLHTALWAQSPVWMNYHKRKALFPDNRYFTGFSTDIKPGNMSVQKFLAKLKEDAKAEMAGNILTTVKSISTSHLIVENGNEENIFKSVSTSISKVDLTGYQAGTYFDTLNNRGYAFAHVEKKSLIDYYTRKFNQLKEEVSKKIPAAIRFFKEGNKESALKTFFECMPLLREAESAYTIILTLKASDDQIMKIYEYEMTVKKGIDKIFNSRQKNLQELCSFLTYSLKMQTGSFDKRIRIGSITYEDTKMSSRFSRRFINTMEKEMIEEGSYNVSAKAQKPGSPPPGYLLTGTYWQDSANLNVVLILWNTGKGKPLASAQGSLPVSWLKEHAIAFKPENFGQAAENMRQFRKNEIVNGGMHLELWTNKGDDSPVFEENDTLTLYVRANRMCYLRIVDYMADGSKVLLVDNMYLGSDKVNRVVHIPDMFVCAPPFGTEVLQANAQTKEFSPLHTKNVDGYDFIDDDINNILSNTRGFKRISNKDMKAETRVVVTTIKKTGQMNN